MKILSSLDAIAASYDAILCDVWGVLHNGRTAYPAACAALQRARAAGKRVILITNVPKPRGPIPAQLDRAGVPRDAWDAIVTSGDAIRAELALRAPGPMYKIGPDDYDRQLWEGLGLATAPLAQARFVAISGLNDDNETPADYAQILREARARDLDMLCANPDIIVQFGDRMIWCAGAVARDYEKLGGRVIMAGKPYPPIYELAYRELAALGAAPDKARILAIGDGVPTDLLGANRQGIDVLFVASGMHGEALWSNGALDPEKVNAALAPEGARATYAMSALA
ncbi:TIGR01459 family HAD-type hydrolase [Terricaulis sp.]|uniref:TIGR01459 family HAD-type hydrolase n=1 Tax=Terricaulis sp. TaxID=2768686 RepID=UPI0037850413